jgi:hypothetical protein
MSAVLLILTFDMTFPRYAKEPDIIKNIVVLTISNSIIQCSIHTPRSLQVPFFPLLDHVRLDVEVDEEG